MYPNGYKMDDRLIADFVKEMRKKFNLTQVDLADKSGVGLRFVRELEQGKQTLRMDKVNQVLSLLADRWVPWRYAPGANMSRLCRVPLCGAWPYGVFVSVFFIPYRLKPCAYENSDSISLRPSGRATH